ncbi:hypothetical protein RhiirA1_457619 [Rhizophagus irregularis]|uniref:Uncharacterized protein n=1 Tax=Rhizophagus irregularis TaxID=588596 RepID=A0A2I1F3L3_9GLOM|nr:hypothetical protein RhiirA1_457619 [Rhizophagus irregularis]PKY28962.1 hypothetical protein RhiirB3_445371 [Rhizophagus irregularis]
MFDVKLNASAIKKRYEWQAYKKIDNVDYLKKKDEEIKYIKIFGPRWKTIWEKAFKIKGQDELIGEEGVYKKRFGINRFKVPTQTSSKDKFFDAQADPISTIPRTQEEHEELDNLNNSRFSARLETTSSLSKEKGKAAVITKEDEDKINKNKKRVMATQGQREDSDNE